MLLRWSFQPTKPHHLRFRIGLFGAQVYDQEEIAAMSS